MQRTDVNSKHTFLWMVKQITGVMIFLLIAIHLIVNHLVAPNGLMSYSEVIAYLGNPWIAAMEITFLVVVCIHALLGLRSIFLDLNPGLYIIKWADRLLLIIGTISIAYGIILTCIIVARQLNS